MRRVGAADKVEWAHLQAARQAVDDVDCFLAAERLFQQLARVVDTTSSDKVLSAHQVLELFQNLVFKLGVNRL